MLLHPLISGPSLVAFLSPAAVLPGLSLRCDEAIALFAFVQPRCLQIGILPKV
jgi:hypothetical protein